MLYYVTLITCFGAKHHELSLSSFPCHQQSRLATPTRKAEARCCPSLTSLQRLGCGGRSLLGKMQRPSRWEIHRRLLARPSAASTGSQACEQVMQAFCVLAQEDPNQPFSSAIVRPAEKQIFPTPRPCKILKYHYLDKEILEF